MTGALLRKELRAVLPLAVLWAILWGSNLVEHLLLEAPDLGSFHTALDHFDSVGATAFLGALASLWLASLLLPAERASGTAEFLDSLPATRDRVFCVKAAAGLLVLWSGPVLHVAVAYAAWGLAHTSVQPAPPPAIVGTWLGLVAVEMAVFFGVSLLLSFLGRFQWLAAAAILLTWLTAARLAPAAHVLDPAAVATTVPVGRALAIPWRPLAVQVPIGVVCAAAAWFLHRGAWDRIGEVAERMGSTLAGRLLGGAATVLAVAAWIGGMTWVALQDEERMPKEDDAGVRYASWGRSTAVTEHYVFTYPSSLDDRAAVLVAAADRIHETVRTYFGAEPIGTIDVDATTAGPPHYAARAFHEAMQIDLVRPDDDAELLANFGHETAHLYIDASAQSRLDGVFRWVRLLHEGLANHLGFELFLPPADVAQVREAAALAHAWDPIEFERLLDDADLCATRDPNLVYTAGEVLFAALDDVAGPGGAPRLVRAFGRPERPADLSRIDLWRDAFQAAGISMEAVVDRFYARLDEEKRRYASVVDSLPRPRGNVFEQTGPDGTEWVGVTPTTDRPLPDGWEFHVRFRRSRGDGMDDFIAGDPNGGAWWVRRSSFPHRSAEYEIGVASRAERVAVWDLWRPIALSR